MGTGLNILLVTPTWEGSLGFFCQRAFRRMGHTVTEFDYRRHALGASYGGTVSAGWAHVALNRLGMALMNRRLRRTVSRYGVDLVLVVKGELVEPSTVRAIGEEGGAATALWYPDAGGYLSKRSYRRIARSMAYYDVTLLCDPAHIPEVLKPTIKRAEFLTFGCDPEYHSRVPLPPEEAAHYGSRLTFVGNPHGAGSRRDSMLVALGDQPLTVWGNSWERTPLAQSPSVALRGPAYGRSMIKVYSGSEIVLNVSYESYLIFRNFEVPACGPLLITEDVRDLPAYFRPGEEVVTFSEIDDLRDKVAYYLAHPDQARAIARRGQARAHGEHTFVHRMQQVLATVFGQ